MPRPFDKIRGFDKVKSTKNFHAFFRYDRMILCGCMPCMRINGKVKVPSDFRNTRRNSRSPLNIKLPGKEAE